MPKLTRWPCRAPCSGSIAGWRAGAGQWFSRQVGEPTGWTGERGREPVGLRAGGAGATSIGVGGTLEVRAAPPERAVALGPRWGELAGAWGRRLP